MKGGTTSSCTLILASLALISYAGGTTDLTQSSMQFQLRGFGGGYYPKFTNTITSAFSDSTISPLNPAVFNSARSMSKKDSSAAWGGEIAALWMSPYRFMLGASATAMSSNSHTTHTHTIKFAEIRLPHTFTESLSTRYNYDVAAILGYGFPGGTSAYAKAGASRIQLRDTFSGSHPSPTLGRPVTTQQNISLNGYLLGLGLTQSINQIISIFAEYDYYNYHDKNMGIVTFNLLPLSPTPLSGNIQRKINLSANTFRLGLLAALNV